MQSQMEKTVEYLMEAGVRYMYWVIPPYSNCYHKG